MILAIVVFGGTVDGDSSAGAWIAVSILYALLIAAVVLLYAPLLMMREGDRNGQTLGKQVTGIRVVRDNGQPMSFGWAALREVVLKQLAVNIASSIIPIIPVVPELLLAAMGRPEPRPARHGGVDPRREGLRL